VAQGKGVGIWKGEVGGAAGTPAAGKAVWTEDIPPGAVSNQAAGGGVVLRGEGKEDKDIHI